MGNGVDFFSRDEKGRRSEYTALEPSKIVNGVKGTVIKKTEIKILIQAYLIILILLTFILGKTKMGYVRLVFISGIRNT